MSPHFFISQYFLFPLGLKKRKNLLSKAYFYFVTIFFVYNQKRFENEGGLVDSRGNLLE
jgi:hypothetical protein